MSRPKSTAPTKGRLSITVSEQTRLELTYISQNNQKSISECIADFAKSESRKISKKNWKTYADRRTN